MTEESQQPSPFFGGFAIGVCIGAIGYYLLGTDDGRRVKDKIVKEWHETRTDLEKMAQEMGGRAKPISLRGVMVTALKELNLISQKTKVALPAPRVPAKVSKPKTATKTSRTAKKSELKFKGA
jgi:hypothetical protein